MKKIFIAKSGLEFRFLQCVIIFPINLIISHILQTVFNEQIIVFISSFIIINILWIIRNSFVIFENGKIKFRIIGIPQTVDCSNATELRLIDSKELSKTYRSITAQNPVQTNFFNLLLPINHTITFKNQNYSTVLISVYKSDELLFLIEEFIEDDQNAEPQQNKDAENTQSVAPRQSYTGSRTEKYFIKMPFGSHIKCYLKSFVVTIISPAVLSAVLSFTFSMRFDALDFNTMFIILFVILSVLHYMFKINLIIQNKMVAAIKLTCYVNKATPSIMYQYIKDVHYISSMEEQQNILNTKQNIIKTPHPDYFWENVLYIELENGTAALLSVHNHEKLYNHLKQYLINKENSL